MLFKLATMLLVLTPSTIWQMLFLLNPELFLLKPELFQAYLEKSKKTWKPTIPLKALQLRPKNFKKNYRRTLMSPLKLTTTFQMLNTLLKLETSKLTTLHLKRPTNYSSLLKITLKRAKKPLKLNNTKLKKPPPLWKLATIKTL